MELREVTFIFALIVLALYGASLFALGRSTCRDSARGGVIVDDSMPKGTGRVPWLDDPDGGTRAD